MDKIKQFIEEEKYDIALIEKVNFKQPEGYLQTITMLANGNNIGYVIFGINSKKNKITGIERIMKSYQEIIKNVKIYIRPNLEPIIKLIHIEGKNIILVKIIPKKGKTYWCILEDKAIIK